MDGNQIAEKLNQKRLNFPILAAACGASVGHVYNVAYRNVTSRPIATKIAKALGEPFEAVFPDYAAKDAAKHERAKWVRELAKIVNA